VNLHWFIVALGAVQMSGCLGIASSVALWEQLGTAWTCHGVFGVFHVVPRAVRPMSILVFQPFVQAHLVRGLGLHASVTVTEMHGAKAAVVSVSSKPKNCCK
jgi:hypothetical protein